MSEQVEPIQPSVGVVNSITDIRKFMEGEKPFAPGEFIEFWKSLTDEEKAEFMNTPLK